MMLQIESEYGDISTCSLEEFLQANDGLPEAELEAIKHITTCSFTIGGGASVMFTITRL